MDWLKKNKLNYQFHNYKEDGITAGKLNEWSGKVGWEKIFNKRSTTWRELSLDDQKAVKDQQSAVKVMLLHNSIIKRPVLEFQHQILVGFDEKEYASRLLK